MTPRNTFAPSWPPARALTPPQSEADVLERIASTYGAPDEVAEAYRTTEKKVTAALRLPLPPPKQTALGRFFGVYGDSRAWGALFYLLLALFTGLFYFATAAIGMSLSLGLAVLIIGVPFFLLFVGFTRVLSLAEGRLVEGLLGVRMPRRPLTPTPGTWWERIKDMLGDRRTWTTLIYMVLQLPLGIFYFMVTVIGLSISLALLCLPLGALFNQGEMVFGNINGVQLTADFNGLEFVVVPLVGLLLLTTLHACRARSGPTARQAGENPAGVPHRRISSALLEQARQRGGLARGRPASGLARGRPASGLARGRPASGLARDRVDLAAYGPPASTGWRGDRAEA